MQFIMWCRSGAMRLDATDPGPAVIEAMAYATKYRFSVTVTDGEFADIAFIPPTIQSDLILPLLFGEIVPEVAPSVN